MRSKVICNPNEWAQFESGYPPYVEKFVDWLVTPKSERVPATQQALAEELGVRADHLSHLKQDKRVRELIDKKAQELNVDTIRIQEVVDAMHDRAKKGDVNAARLYLEYTKVFKPVQRIEIEDKSVESMSDEEFYAQLKAAIPDAVTD